MSNNLLEFCWNELVTPDVKGSKEFYTKLLGWVAADTKCAVPGSKEAVEYIVFKKDAKDKDMAGVAGLMKKNCSGSECGCSDKKASWISYVCVKNVDETASKAEKLGGKILCKPMDIPSVGRIAIIADPSGAVLGLYAEK